MTVSGDSQFVELPVQGMHCASCVARVEKTLDALPGVFEASANLVSSQARLRVNPEQFRIDQAVQSLASAGYDVPVRTLRLDVEAMHCGSCIARVEAAAGAVSGVAAAEANLADSSLRVEVMAGDFRVPDLLRALRDAGYPARLAEQGISARQQREQRDRQELRHLKGATLLAAALTLPIFLTEMGSHLIPGFADWLQSAVGITPILYTQMLLATVVQFGPGWRFYRLGGPALWRGSPDMHSLVMLGTTAAYGYSVIATVIPGVLPEAAVHVYFEPAAVIITLVLLGRYIETRAKGRTGDAIRHLLALQAPEALVRRGQDWQLQAIEAVAPGDRLLVRPGERIPLDGTVLVGESWVDESMLSGEPEPVRRGPEQAVVGGSVNGNSSLEIRVDRTGEDTVLANIIRMVQDAQAAKLPIQAVVDRVTARFVPAVLLVAVITFGVWLLLGDESALSLALVNAVAVLIIACPCAMGLATPVSIMVGTGRAAEMGILFRGGDALQSLRDVKLVAFDKTGTLTVGKPELTHLELAPGGPSDEKTALRLLASMERHSEHPLAAAIVAAAPSDLLDASAVEVTAGQGIAAMVDGRALCIGSERFLARQGIDLSGFSARAMELAAEGRTVLFAADDGQPLALIAVSDPIRHGAGEAVRRLQARGLRCVMITGDGWKTAESVATALGIDDVRAETLPGDKAGVVRELQEEGGSVAFVGDGINDAPALAQADIGIAVGSGTDVAIESADVVLMGNDLRRLDAAIRLSSATLRNIRQNLVWAFGYNILLIPVAAGLLYPLLGLLLSPMLAALAMGMSSISVLANALRLKRLPLGG